MPELIEGRLYLRSLHCLRQAPHYSSRACSSCNNLRSDPVVIGICDRAINGCSERTNHKYLTINQLRELLQRQAAQINSLKLTALNHGRTIASRTAHLNDFNRFLMAVASGQVERIGALVSVALNNGVGIQGILDKIERAINQLYAPQSYTQSEFDRSILALRFGGAQLLNLLTRSSSFPHLRTVQRHATIPQLRSSAGPPTEEEMSFNLSATLPHDPEKRCVGATLMVDEIAIKKALRLDIDQNLILGMCREHTSQHCTLEFTSYEDATAILQAIREETAHLASEATVIAVGAFSGDSKIASMPPVAISGSCKRENAYDHAAILRRAVKVCSEHPSIRIYCIVTDGESRRRQSIAGVTLVRELSPAPEGSLYSLLARLPLFNTLCGSDEITACTDKKHNDKRCRNTLIRPKGILIDGVHITADIIEQHLTHVTPSTPSSVYGPALLSTSAAAACLNPNDKQNVPLAFRLLAGVACLRDPLLCDSPTFALKRRILNLVGSLYCYLLDPITDISMSLGQQLTYLSAAAHMLLALYAANKGAFMPTQLYYYIQTYIKCAYFCVAKTKLDDPLGRFYITLLGTDRLEAGFGHVRTMTGSDSNVDQLQLTSRLSASSECAKLLESHKDWNPPSRRLKYTGLRGVLGSPSRYVDHLGPSSWTGDTLVANVNLQTCWQVGKRHAIEKLKKAQVSVPFEEMIRDGGFDIMCPFGQK
ncbi:hypothetical protein BDV93DRAFT_585605, partial [Ceratobasidium sp. AG-I]